MKAFLSIKYHPDLHNKDKIEIIMRILESCGINPFCVARDFEKWGQVHFDPQELMSITLREIRSTHLVVVDLEEKGVGVGIECGYAAARGIPIVTIAPRGSDVSLTLQGISREIVYYTAADDLTPYFQQLADW